MRMEHQTEESGTVPPDQVPAAYAAEPLFGPTSEMAGEGDPAAEADDELVSDVADDRAAEADDELVSDVADGPAVEADDDRAAGPAERPATGEPRVDAALARLDDLEGLPVTEHRAVFEDVHRRLRDVLGELDTGQQPGSGDAAGAESRRGR